MGAALVGDRAAQMNRVALAALAVRIGVIERHAHDPAIVPGVFGSDILLPDEVTLLCVVDRHRGPVGKGIDFDAVGAAIHVAGGRRSQFIFVGCWRLNAGMWQV